MSIAYPVAMVRVIRSVNMNGRGVEVGSSWVSGNLLFRHHAPGQAVQASAAGWAQAEDQQGRMFFIWQPQGRQEARLVIQRVDSLYCYEVEPLEA